MKSSKTPFKLKKVHNRSFDVCTPASYISEEQRSSDIEKDDNDIWMGRYGSNTLITNTKTLGSISISNDSLVIIEDHCIRALCRTPAGQFKVTSEVYSSPSIVQYSPTLSDSKCIVVFTTEREIIYYRLSIDASSITLRRDRQYGTRPLDFIGLPDSMLVNDVGLWLLNEKTQSAIFVSKSTNEYEQQRVSFHNFQTVVHSCIIQTSSEDVIFLFFHIDMQSTNLRLEVFEPYLTEGGDRHSAKRIHTMNLGQSGRIPSYFYQFELHSILVVNSKATMILSEYPIIRQRWTNEGLGDVENFEIVCARVIKDDYSSGITVEILKSDMTLYKGVLDDRNSIVKWEANFVIQSKVNTSFATMLRDGTVIFRDSDDLLKVSNLLVNGNLIANSVLEMNTRCHYLYERIVYYCACQRLLTQSALSHLVYGGVNLSNLKPFVETSETILKSHNCSHAANLDKIKGNIELLGYRNGILSAFDGNDIYEIGPRGATHEPSEQSQHAVNISQNGNFIYCKKDDVIFTTNVQVLSPLIGEQHVELYVHESGQVEIISFNEYDKEIKVYYNKMHEIGNTVNLVAAAAVDNVGSFVFLINEDSGLNLYYDGDLLYRNESTMNYIKEAHVLDIGFKGTNGCVALIYGDGTLLYKDLSLAKTYLKLDAKDGKCFKMIPRFIDHMMSIVYNDHDIYLISNLNFKIIRIPMSFAVHLLSVNVRPSQENTELFIVDSRKQLHVLSVHGNIEVDTQTQRTEYGKMGGVTVSICPMFDLPNELIIATHYAESRKLTTQVFDIKSRLFVPNGYTIDGIGSSIPIFQLVDGVVNHAVANLFVVYFEKSGKPFYHILGRKLGQSSLDILYESSLQSHIHSIESYILFGTTVYVRFIGTAVYSNYFAIKTNDGMVKVELTESNKNDAKDKDNFNHIVPLANSEIHQNGVTITNREKVAFARTRSNVISNVNKDIFPNRVLIKKVCQSSSAIPRPSRGIEGFELNNVPLFYESLFRSNSKKPLNEDCLSLKLDVDDSVHITHIWENMTFQPIKLCAQGLTFQSDCVIKNIIRYPGEGYLTTRVVAHDSAGKEIFYEFTPLFLVLGERTTKNLLGECRRISTGHSVSDGLPLPVELPSHKVILKSNATPDFLMHYMEVTD
ncbi:hypothetical protein DAKH74_041490 [Maudiozyma humilis]|uniref:Cleavage/polyadenylation specificity factor A subunit C-terminal domain-containing protein n=1 Tax=Maudiozyma humilis TaxID=51915 RepID=A0AAV5S1V9_MAUHU|nr:hypothetical protein DAKH74_041490 [Kazachstania humilis]